MFHLDQIEVSHKSLSEDGKFTIIREGPLKGNIYDNDSKIVSSSFTNCEETKYKKSEFELSYLVQKEHQPNNYFTPYYEGPHVKVWFDDSGELRFSNDNKIDCKNSFWGNKEEKFWDLFYNNGGEKFIKKFPDEMKKIGLTHHFMIVNKNLLITSRVDLRDNDTIIVYLGTTLLDGKILEITSIDTEVYFYNPDRSNVFPLKEELQGRIMLPTKITFDEAVNVLTNGFGNTNYETFIQDDIIKGECVIWRDGVNKIIKFTPENYELRTLIAGSTPNVKSRLFTLLDSARKKEDYESTFPIIGCLDSSKLKLIHANEKIMTTFGVNLFIGKEKLFNINSLEDRMNNILVLCILCCPLTKINTFIDSWFEYNECKDKIIKFIKSHSQDLRNDKYDERLKDFHQKALLRLKDLAKVSKIYANNKNNGLDYESRMIKSLKGLVCNEYGPSLYRINKAVNYIQE